MLLLLLQPLSKNTVNNRLKPMIECEKRDIHLLRNNASKITIKRLRDKEVLCGVVMRILGKYFGGFIGDALILIFGVLNEICVSFLLLQMMLFAH